LRPTFKPTSFFKPDLDDAKKRLLQEISKQKNQVVWDERVRTEERTKPRIPAWKAQPATAVVLEQSQRSLTGVVTKSLALMSGTTPPISKTKTTVRPHMPPSRPASTATTTDLADQAAKALSAAQAKKERKQHEQNQMMIRAAEAARQHKPALLEHLTMEINRAKTDPPHAQHLTSWENTGRNPPRKTNQQAARQELATKPSLDSIQHLLYAPEVEVTEGLYASIRWSCRNTTNVRIFCDT